MTGPLHEVLVTVEAPFEPGVDEKWLADIARHVLSGEGVGATELDILITGDATIHGLNREYAGEDAPTDVLAFSLQEGEEFAAPDSVTRLGEVIISMDTAVRQATEADRPTTEEVAHLLVHGILHLLGYDHAEPEEERVMRARETDLLASFADRL